MAVLGAFILLVSVGAKHLTAAQNVGVVNNDTSLTLLYQNNLNASDDQNHVGFVLLDSTDLGASCSSISQQLLPLSTAQQHSSDLGLSLAYQQYAGYYSAGQSFSIDGKAVSGSTSGDLVYTDASSGSHNPLLCSNSAVQGLPQNSTATADTIVSIAAGSNTYTGYFNKKSFRFNGIKYAQQPERFGFSSLYERDGETVNATAYGPQCIQGGGGSEDCLYLNIQTPYVPASGSSKNLRPVMFWIHGGKQTYNLNTMMI